MKNVILIGGIAAILGAVVYLAFLRPSAPLEKLARSNLDELSCSGEIIAESMNAFLYSDPAPEEVIFLSGREVQDYEGISPANSKSISYVIAENRAQEIFGVGFNGESLRTARINAREQLGGTLTCSIYLPSSIQYGPFGERVVHIRPSDRTASSIELIVAKSHSEIVEFLTQELAPPESDNAIDSEALLPPSSGD